MPPALPYDEYDVPDTWTPDEVVSWLNETLMEPGVHSAEFYYEGTNFVARVWYQDPAGTGS